MSTHIPADAQVACMDKFDLFTSTNPRAHTEAKTICATCPVFAACAKNRPAPDDFDGTWAGVGYHIQKAHRAA